MLDIFGNFKLMVSLKEKLMGVGNIVLASLLICLLLGVLAFIQSRL